MWHVALDVMQSRGPAPPQASFLLSNDQRSFAPISGWRFELPLRRRLRSRCPSMRVPVPPHRAVHSDQTTCHGAVRLESMTSSIRWDSGPSFVLCHKMCQARSMRTIAGGTESSIRGPSTRQTRSIGEDIAGAPGVTPRGKAGSKKVQTSVTRNPFIYLHLALRF